MNTQDALAARLQAMDELDQYDYFIDAALAASCPDIRRPEYQIRGCVSGLWVRAQLNGGRIEACADSDSLLIRGIAALICRIYTGMTTEEARCTPITFLDGLDLAGELDNTRRSGLRHMIQVIQSIA
ncbi:MAG: SufE family protein [Clostridia bacterium]|nr:SufE family protein [Clostridia bacterium]